ncbi:MAG TPA: rhodanese-like domain-containing protein [Hyphomicrobiales bacterium]|nr:rhodanese-like domain-containing protein [Kaistiaceae bacterium]HQF31269.1 rhodanese-like domain-containing protein [Hyphomicrobiales bacterium]
MLTADVAHEQAVKGEVLLVDIRSPQEWMQTGVGEGAVAITMHSHDFLDKLMEAMEGDQSKPIALICATGNRSRWLQYQLMAHGFTSVEDVGEGMLGGPNGPGWLNRRLPVARPGGGGAPAGNPFLR